MIEVFPNNCQSLDFLLPAIEQTFQIIDRFVNRYAGTPRIELPYGTNERATLSLLAGGIWRSDPSSLVLEEYACVKGAVGAAWKGRRDLWFQLGGHTCHAEAKQEDWPCAASFNGTEATACLGRALQEAHAANRDSANSTCLETYSNGERTNVIAPEPIRSFGVAFVVPYLYLQERALNESIMDDYAQKLRVAARQITQDQSCRILWGRYYRPALLEKSRFFKSRWKGTWLAMPELDILFCESSHAPTRMAESHGGTITLNE